MLWIIGLLSPGLLAATGPLDDTCTTAAPGGAVNSGSVSFLPRELGPGDSTDHFRIVVQPGLRADIQAVFAAPLADVQLRLWNADCSVLLDESIGTTSSEQTEWLNDTGAAQEVVAEVFVDVPLAVTVGYSLRVAGTQELCDFDDVFEPNETCGTAPSASFDGGILFPLTLTPADEDWLRFDVLPTLSVQFNVIVNGPGTTEAELWSGDCATLLVASGSGPLRFANGSATTESILLRVRRTDQDPACSIYSVVPSTSIGARECTSVPNSTGFPASLFGVGSTSVAGNGLFLEASTVPTDQFGLYAYGPDAGSTPLGGGVLCIAPGGLVRGPVSQALFQSLTMRVDTTSPAPGQGPIAAGTTLRFQAWFRDPADPSGFGLSDALRITFAP